MNILVKEGEHKNLFIDGDSSIEFVINKNASLTLKYAFFTSNKEINIRGDLEENAKLNAVIADFSNGELTVKANINLNKEGSEATWNLASLSTNNDNKKFDISFIHNARNSKADMQNYGVALDLSNLTFSGINHIKKAAKKSNTNQSAKIIVFDKDAKGKANPILKIDENDVLASHSAVVGRLNDDHLFYLKSRGLNEKEAKALIVSGYLRPIANYFSDEIKERINHTITEKCHV